MRENHGPVKYFANYAGWGIEQLETELNEGAWLVADASPPDIFSDLNDEQWSSLMTKLTLGQWIDPDELLEDPSVN
jgi:putative transcriptional regulator